ncbi:MAG TPA: 50S ribosomal protein L25/general stress protein Ctc [Gemmatimonadaceae bacterium]|nr:50S ribosomal protein L25/general stress protein Ctc [Gemmatimonadaceae bacterium]
MTATLSASKRSDTGKGAARKLRAAQMIPGVIYGHNREPLALSMSSRELDRLLERIAAETTVVELTIDGTMSRTLIREIQRHPFKREVLHVDFLELVAGEKVTVDLPIVLVGTPEGVRSEGGILDQILREVSVEVDPVNMPSHIELDVSALGINDSLHVSDLKVPEGVELLIDAEATVCVVSPPHVEEEPVAPEAGAEAEAAAEPELIRKPKAEDEEGAEEEK